MNRHDIFFILKDQLNYGSLCSLGRYKDLNEKTLDMVVTEALNVIKGLVEPLQEIGEKWEVKFDNKKVSCAPEFKEAFRQFGEGGWIAAARDPLYGGQGFPHMIRIVIADMAYGACTSFAMAQSLTHGAGHLIETFGTKEQKELFVPKMFRGRWSGTMCLTEPEAGSNLANIQTMAFPEGDHYKIKGSKIFISWGDHDLAENIIHLLLARIEGAPDGVKGISLFVVPKIRVSPDGSLEGPNDVICERVEEKLGLHASPTCALSFGEHDDCIGYLCGEKDRGLAYMFQMMNASRINAGTTGMALASTAYLNALAYAKGRIQGVDAADRKPGFVPIIDHPDVRRMLLWMKATVDGMRSMVYSTAYWGDLSLEMADEGKKHHYQALLDFMTPMVKAYCSEMGFRVCETAIQCLGGYGYIKEYALEQYLRDAKILSIYEGTNGIQSMDLMGRKMRINGGAPYEAFMTELKGFCRSNREHPTLRKEVLALSRIIEKLEVVAAHMISSAKSDPLQWASHTYPALLSFAEVAMAWRLLDMATVAQQRIDEGQAIDFYLGKVKQATYFVGVTLPLTAARLDTCLRPWREITEIPEKAF
jgi:alkylation response protein AidB-like acyl-CoA dehydrogenase